MKDVTLMGFIFGRKTSTDIPKLTISNDNQY